MTAAEKVVAELMAEQDAEQSERKRQSVAEVVKVIEYPVVREDVRWRHQGKEALTEVVHIAHAYASGGEEGNNGEDGLEY